TRLLHISASPRGAASASLEIAGEFARAYARTNPDPALEHWELWDGRLRDFGLAAVTAKMTVFGGEDPAGDAAAAWDRVHDTFARFDCAEQLLFCVPTWD